MVSIFAGISCFFAIGVAPVLQRERLALVNMWNVCKSVTEIRGQLFLCVSSFSLVSKAHLPTVLLQVF